MERYPQVVAVGAEDMTTEALLILLAPWLRAVVSPETNAVVFRRTMDGVLEALLRHFPEDDAGGEEDDAMGLSGEVEDEVQMFKRAELVKIQACIFEAAAAEQVMDAIVDGRTWGSYLEGMLQISISRKSRFILYFSWEKKEETYFGGELVVGNLRAIRFPKGFSAESNT